MIERGLSPRLRGNLSETGYTLQGDGSIPAPAGEPRPRGRPRAECWVYPRACGGTFLSLAEKLMGLGLSPRLRGNQLLGHRADRLAGSIPAPAGEPPAQREHLPLDGVYPRACGGTVNAIGAGPASTGLSPRLRGNHPPV